MRALYLALFGIGLVVYGVFAWGRIWHQSSAPQFVYQADAWLHGTSVVAPSCGPCGPDDPCDPPPRKCGPNEWPLPGDDWATVETVALADGTTVRGRRLVQPRFKTLAGDELSISEIAQPKPVQQIRDGDKTCATIAGAQTCWPAAEPAEIVTLVDGTDVAGRRISKFRTLTGDELPTSQIARSVGFTTYVSFPAVPSLLMLPGAAIAGRAGNDVFPTIVIAALILPLMLLVLRRLVDAGLSQRTLSDDLWLVGMLAFGSVLFFSAVQGKVWFTAHVVGIVLALVYAWASIEARRPVVAGLALALATLTRTSMAFMLPLYLYEVWRMAARAQADDVPAHASERMNLRERRRAMLRSLRKPLVRFVVPLAAIGILGMLYNYVRFDSPTEFGHSYLALGNHQPVRQQLQIEAYGLASYHYLGRNLAVAFTLLPELVSHAPWVQVSGHGLAMWVTTPALLLLVWPRQKGPLHRVLWLTTLAVALPSLLYMNSGWLQFGYRFSLDYIVLLVMLLAIGGRPLGRVAKTLIVVGVIVNAFGAYTFDRVWDVYRTRGNAYDTVVGE